MKKIIILALLLLPTIVQAQEQIDSIKLIETTSDSLVFVVHSTIMGGVYDAHGKLGIGEIEYLEEGDTLKIKILYSQVILMACYCPEQTTIKIKKDAYTKAVVEVMTRMMINGTFENPEFDDYRRVDIKEVNLSETSIHDFIIDNNNIVIICPNPIENTFYVDLKGKENRCLKIYNQQGCLLLNKNIINSQNIDVSFLPSGLYFVVVGKEYVYKIIKK